jgi:predicted TIM-barrel fold metal-dependent hydrolase
MRIVTLEEHILTPGFSAATRNLRSGPPLKLRERMEPALLDMGEGRLHAMDEAGISLQVLSLAADGLDELPRDEAVALAADANDRIAAAVSAHPDRFAGFAILALTDVDAAVEEMYRARQQLGFAGVMLHGTTQGIFLDDERFEPVWAAAEDLRVPVYLHPAPPPPEVQQAYYSGLPGNMGHLLAIAAWGWHAETGLHVLRLIVSGLFDRHPGLRLIVGHMGENLPFSIARASGVLDQMSQHLKRPVEEYFHKHFWITTSGYFTVPPFQCALEVVGIDRMLFSIDYPFSSTGRGRKFLDSLELGQGDLKKLAYANAQKLLGLAG